MKKSPLGVLIACAFAAAAGAQPGASAQAVIPQTRELSFMDLDRAEARARYGHPNEMWRYRALRAFKLEQPERALENFRSAARYGDKFSQHALSLMYWHGVGAAADRAQAHAWSDLAAERGYRDLLLLREKMWMEMTAVQRAQALLLGEALYSNYGDAVARPRMEWELRKALAGATGSRVGFEKDRILFTQHGAAGDAGLSAREFHTAERWSPRSYWREQDRQWNSRVIVQPPETIRGDPPPRCVADPATPARTLGRRAA